MTMKRRCFGGVRYLDDADGLPGKVEAGVQQEGEDQGEGLVPAQTKTDSREQYESSDAGAKPPPPAHASWYASTDRPITASATEGVSKVTACRRSRTSCTALFTLRLPGDLGTSSHVTESKHKRHLKPSVHRSCCATSATSSLMMVLVVMMLNWVRLLT